MPSTDLARSGLRTCYALSGTHIAAMLLPDPRHPSVSEHYPRSPMPPRTRYAMSSTGIAYGPTHLLRRVRDNVHPRWNGQARARTVLA
eukprot:1804805-Rhodomonas_salina.3